ncbi:MAG TPA: hypothetical protein VIH61_09555, partial [Waddliaceae bacterium]
NQTIEAWIYLSKSYCKNYDFNDGIAIWERLVSLEPHPHYTSSLKELTETFLESLLEVPPDITVLSTISKVLMNKSSYVCSYWKKAEYLKQCFKKAEKLDFKQTHSLIVDFLEELLNKHAWAKNEEAFIDDQTIIFMTNFLKFILTSKVRLPVTLIDKLKMSLSTIVIQLHKTDKHTEVYKLIEQFSFHKIDLELNIEAAEGCLRAISPHLASNRKAINLFIKIFEQAPSTFSEKEIKKIAQTIFHEIRKKQTPLDIGLFLINERTLMLKASSLRDWHKEVIKIIQRLSAHTDSEKSITTALQLLVSYEVTESHVWKLCFELTSDKRLLKQVWENFCLLNYNSSLTGENREKALCWHAAFSALSKINDKEIVSYLNRALEEISPFSVIFSDTEVCDIKNQTFILVILTCLKHLQGQGKRQSISKTGSEATHLELCLNIMKLQKSLSDYDTLDTIHFPSLVQCDYQLINTFALIDNPQIFHFVCQRLAALIGNGFRKSSWTKELTKLIYLVLARGSIYEKRKGEKEWNTIITMLASQVSIIREVSIINKCLSVPIEIDLPHLCKLLINYNSSDMLNELSATLLSLLNGSSSLKEVLNTTLEILIKKETPRCLENARLILTHNRTAECLGPLMNSYHWGDYLLAAVKLNSSNGNAAENLLSIQFIMENYYLIIDNGAKEKACMEKIVDLLVKQIDQGLIHHFSCTFFALTHHLIHATLPPLQETQGIFPEVLVDGPTLDLSKRPADFFVFKKNVIIGKHPLVVIFCHPANPQNKQLSEFRKRFFYCSSLLFKEIMKKTYPDDELQEAIHSFIYSHLFDFVPHFEENQNELIQLMETWV